jgi:hypothetical protein
MKTEELGPYVEDQLRRQAFFTADQGLIVRAEEMRSYKAEGRLRYGDLCFAGRPIGTVKAISFSGSTQNKPPSVVFIDEVALRTP